MIGWSEVTVAIPTVRERAEIFDHLLADVARHCNGAEVVTITHDPAEPACVDFPRVMRAAARCGRPWVLQLEDDVALAPTFGSAAVALDMSDVDLLTLFSRSRRDIEAMDRGESRRRFAPADFSMSQGFFIRAEFAAGIRDFAPGWYAAHPEHQRAADLLLASYLSTRKARCWARVPSLVQHRRLPSTLPGHHGARQSESFRRAFGEVDE